MKTDIINLFQNYSGELSKEEICAMIEVPPREEMGDYAIPCFSFAKKLHKSPMDIAKDLKEYLEHTQSNNVISAVKNIGGYCNIFLNRTMTVLPPLYWQQKGGAHMEMICSFIVVVAAGVVCHYIIKWLDGDQ